MLGYGLVLLPLAAASLIPERAAVDNIRRQLPNEPTGVKTITTPNNVTIRYKEPGKEGICETTPGVNSYSGYIDLAPDAHTFFWFFEARHDPANAPITLWLNGGPGSDSLIGLFEGLPFLRRDSIMHWTQLTRARTWSLLRQRQLRNPDQPVLMERGLQYALPVAAIGCWYESLYSLDWWAVSLILGRVFVQHERRWVVEPLHRGLRERIICRGAGSLSSH